MRLLTIIIAAAMLSTIKTILAADPLQVGAAFPSGVSATNDEGETVNLSEVANQGYTLLFFYPKANTPGCTAQACSLRDAFTDLADLGIRIFGVSGDSVKAQAKFRADHQLPYPLIADSDMALHQALGVRRFSRQALLFHDGVLVWRDSSASTSRQAEDVLAALSALQNNKAEG